MKKNYISVLTSLLLVTALPWSAFALQNKAESLHVDLISPQKSNAPQRMLHVTGEPVVVEREVPVTIPRTPNRQDAEQGRYLVEYFIDDTLVYETNGLVEGVDTPTFNWTLDTTQYKNGKHKLVVNYWDTQSPSAIGIQYFMIENPVSVEELLHE